MEALATCIFMLDPICNMSNPGADFASICMIQDKGFWAAINPVKFLEPSSASPGSRTRYYELALKSAA